jgi:hypothetical protein
VNSATVSSEAFDYTDYHRTVIAFHGTTSEAAERLVSGDAFVESDNDDDWFGKGVYFWEHAPKQAWWWARRFKRSDSPAVIGAIIRLGNCFDLLDPRNVKTLKAFHDTMIRRFRKARIEVPRNARHRRNRDCAVFNFLYREAEQADRAIDSARAVYVPTEFRKRVWKGSWIYEEAHIQICVRNPRNILAVWHVRTDGRYGKPPPAQEQGTG